MAAGRGNSDTSACLPLPVATACAYGGDSLLSVQGGQGQASSGREKRTNEALVRALVARRCGIQSAAMPSSPQPPATASPAAPLRRFGRYSLVRLLGKSARTMAWQVTAPNGPQDLVLMLPRVMPKGDDAMDRWAQRARKTARLDHPNLAPVLEVGVHEGWPFVTCELGERATLTDRVGSKGLAGTETASIASQVLHALAFAHDAGVAHRDVQGWAVLVNDKGVAQVLGLEVACLEASHQGVIDTQSLLAQRSAAEADVLQLGVLMHQMLTGQAALDEPDTGKVVERLPPHGREIVRLPFSTPRPVPEPLRVIVNRSIDRQERQRYRNARTLARALDGWLQVEGSSQGGPMALLLDRMRAVGVLPASPGGAERAARLALMDRGRTDELAEVLLDDVGLALELLRAVNTAQVRGAQVSGNGPVLTIRRSLAMIGLEGVRRVALALRPWPGPLAEQHADDLQAAMDRARRAGRVAMSIRPAGYDPEVVYLIALLQNLGRLVVQYHFADESAQIRRLTQPAPAEEGAGEEPGMSEQAASMAVLGVDLEAIGTAVARWWGLDDSVLHLMRRLSTSAGVRHPESDDEHIRAAASCANEAVDALTLPIARILPALQNVAHRYGRTLGLSLRDLQVALQLVVPAEPAAPMPPPARAPQEARPGP
jgi:eukaryotic-like serine/threonine-protein kinase